ncbi:hypothetical protein E2986_12288 [Frieseomelitta varia]|uniref:Uncharacterized protein n=1 Tax=Frieseomelitta varia TaxID=561572 RepID=A0A833S174_9HYME|nr:hypothetical protein E2986_12288 [Frieseomelitta varia]
MRKSSHRKMDIVNTRFCCALPQKRRKTLEDQEVKDRLESLIMRAGEKSTSSLESLASVS